ncbi:hypothetical protein [Xanthomonas oryzae]|nr:hypothetical protein [Xanthomonas oryzae]
MNFPLHRLFGIVVFVDAAARCRPQSCTHAAPPRVDDHGSVDALRQEQQP